MDSNDYIYGLLCYLISCISVNEKKALKALLNDDIDGNIYYSAKVTAYQNIYDSISDSFLISEDLPL